MVVNPDGSYQLQNQKQLRLKNGECLDLDGNRYKSQQEFQQRMQVRARAMAQEHLVYQNGQLYRMQNQERTQLQEKFQFKNGMQVNPYGSGQMKMVNSSECKMESALTWMEIGIKTKIVTGIKWNTI